MSVTVFIVEDDLYIQHLLVSAFQAKGHTVEAASGGEEALQKLRQDSMPDGLKLLILDRVLPDMDGMEILKWIRHEKKSTVPVILLSSLATDKDILSGLGLGATDYITKPFNIDILMQKAQSVL